MTRLDPVSVVKRLSLARAADGHGVRLEAATGHIGPQVSQVAGGERRTTRGRRGGDLPVELGRDGVGINGWGAAAGGAPGGASANSRTETQERRISGQVKGFLHWYEGRETQSRVDVRLCCFQAQVRRRVMVHGTGLFEASVLQWLHIHINRALHLICRLSKSISPLQRKKFGVVRL